MRAHARRWSAVILVVVGLGAVLRAQTAIQYVYDDLGRLIGVTDPNGDTAVYHYDAVGNITSIDRHVSTQVSIIGFSPSTGPIGTTVTIFGTGFSSTSAQDTVSFHGTAASVSSATATQLVVTVPSGATTGTIGVTAPGGSATSATSYTVGGTSAPTITGLSPVSGVAGTSVTISGTNFDTTAGNDRTQLNSTFVSPSSATTTALTATVPGNAGSGHVTVSTPFGTAVSSADFIVPPPPYVVSDIDNSGRISFNTATTVTVSTANKVALRLFDGTVAQRVSVLGTNGMTGHQIGCDVLTAIFDPYNVIAAAGVCMEGTGFLDATTLPATGTYTIEVDPQGTTTGSVTLTLYSVPADVTATTTPTQAGSSSTVSTTTAGQNALITFPGTSGHRVSVQATSGTYTGSLGCDVLVSLLAPDTTTTVVPTCMEQSLNTFIDATSLPATGTYTMFVDPVNAATGNITLKAFDVPADYTGTITPNGSPVTVSTTTPGQNALLTFSGAGGHRVSLQGTNGMSGQLLACDVNVSIINPDTTTLASPTCMESTGFIDVKTLPATGTYTILTDPTTTAFGNLTLTLYDVPADPTVSLTIGGNAATLTTTKPGQNATATFAATSGQQVTLHMASNSMGQTTVKLLKPDGTQLSSTISSAAQFVLGPQTLPTTGTYTISIDPSGTNTGSITVNVTTP